MTQAVLAKKEKIRDKIDLCVWGVQMCYNKIRIFTCSLLIARNGETYANNKSGYK